MDDSIDIIFRIFYNLHSHINTSKNEQTNTWTLMVKKTSVRMEFARSPMILTMEFTISVTMISWMFGFVCVCVWMESTFISQFIFTSQLPSSYIDFINKNVVCYFVDWNENYKYIFFCEISVVNVFKWGCWKLVYFIYLNQLENWFFSWNIKRRFSKSELMMIDWKFENVMR